MSSTETLAMEQLRAAFGAIDALVPSLSELRELSDTQLRELQEVQAEVDRWLIALEELFRAELARRGLPLPNSEEPTAEELANSQGRVR